MTRRLYLAPITNPLSSRPAALGSKVLEYGVQPRITSVLSRDKAWAITSADFDDTQHDLVNADSDITYIPANRLDDTWNDFTSGQRTAIGNRLEALHVPMDWISVNTSVADLVRMAVRTALLGQMLKADALDDIGLDTTFGQLPAARRNRIIAWANDNSVDTTGLSGSTTIRAMLRALVVRFPWNINHEMPFMREGQSQAFSLAATMQQQSLRAGRIRLEDITFTPQVAVSDDFNRANSTNLGSNWTEDSGDWEISSNQLLQGTAGGSYRKVRWVGTGLASANHYSEADIITGSTALGMGVSTRLTASSTNTYYGYIFFAGDASYLVEITAGVEGILDTGSAVSNSTTYSNCRLTSNGSAHSANRNGGAEDVGATDATLSTSSVGCCAWGGNGADRLDNWDAADLAAAATAIQDMITSDGMIAWRRP